MNVKITSISIDFILFFTAYCPIKTVEGDCCYIPFKYEGEELLGCVLEDSKPWCSVVDTYTKENRKLCNLTVEGNNKRQQHKNNP